MRLYAILNRQAPIPPPSREKVRKLFGEQQYTTVEEFQLIAGALVSRAGVRLVSYKLVTYIAAPLLAFQSVNFLSEKDLPEVIPKSKPFWTAIFTVGTVNQLGVWVLALVDVILDTFQPFRKAFLDE